MRDQSRHPPTADRPFHVMVKPSGPACNLACDYCFYLDKTAMFSDDADLRMSDATLETLVREYLAAHPGPEVTFTWQGGEPTLRGRDFFARALELQAEYAPDDVRVRNAIQTNGTRIDDEWAAFLAEHDFLVGLSLDGPRDLHDAYRRTRGDGATFDRVSDALDRLQAHDVDYNVLCVVNDVNSRHPRRVYDFFRDRGVQWLQFIPLVEPRDAPGAAADDGSTRPFGAVPAWVRERGGDPRDADPDDAAVRAAAASAPVTARSVDPAAYGRFLRDVFDEWVRNDLGRVSVRLFDQCLERRLHGRASLCVVAETCGRQLAVEHDGSVYACDHYVDPGFERGTVHDDALAALVDGPEQEQFGAYKRDGLPERCRTCPVRAYCHGGCPKNRHLDAPNGDPGLNYLCAGYRRFFTYVQPYLDVLADGVRAGRPLPALMDRVTALDARSEDARRKDRE